MRRLKHLGTLLAVLIVLLVGSGSIVSTFSDTEVSSGNTLLGWVPRVWTQTAAADFQAGALDRVDATTIPGSVVLGSSHKDAGVYALAGGTSRNFYRYNVTAGSWAAAATIPFNVGEGAALAFDQSRYIYALQGGGGRNIGRYDVMANSWSVIASTPASVGAGGSLTWDGSALYVMQGSGGRNIWRLDPATLGWSQVALTPSQVGTGASLVIYDDSLYVTRGGGTRTFWKYSMDTMSWATLASAPRAVGRGADLALGPDGTMYGTSGGNQNRFSMYNVAANAWYDRAVFPTVVGSGGGLTFDGTGTLYGLAGGSRTTFSAYTTTSNTWAARANVPMAVNAGGCLVYVPPIQGGYFAAGTFTSTVLDTGAAGTDLNYAFWDRTVPPSTAIVMQLRAADTLAGLSSAPWVSLGSGTDAPLSGQSGRYVQWRALLSTADTNQTPALQEVRVYYA